MDATTERLLDMIDVSDRLEHMWATTGSDRVAHELHDALESVRRAVRMARTNWSEED